MTAAEPVPIAFCITELDAGGAERALTQLVMGLDRSQWLCRVFCLGPRGHFAEVLENAGIGVECFGARGALSFPRVTYQLAKALKRFRPALLQTFLFHGNLVGRLAGRWARVPRIVSGIRVAERRSPWYGRLDRWTNFLVDHNVCVSQGVAKFSIDVSGLPASKVSVIPNGVEAGRFASAEPVDLTTLGIPKGGPVVVTVGRLERQKGIGDLLQAAAEVLKQRQDCQFLVVGDGPDKAALQKQAKSLGISESVLFVGRRGDVPGILKSSALFVLPSLWEGMPNALLEAMAAGLPAVATAVEGSAEIIEQGRSGLLVAPENPRALAEAILTVLGDPELARALAATAQHHVAECFTAGRVIGKYTELYHQMIFGT